MGVIPSVPRRSASVLSGVGPKMAYTDSTIMRDDFAEEVKRILAFRVSTNAQIPIAKPIRLVLRKIRQKPSISELPLTSRVHPLPAQGTMPI